LDIGLIGAVQNRPWDSEQGGAAESGCTHQ